MSLCFSGDCCCEAALCRGEYFNCLKPIQSGTKKKLVFRVLKRQNSRSSRGFAPCTPTRVLPWTYWRPKKAPKPSAELCPPPHPQYQLLSDGPESENISLYLSRKNDMKLKQNIHGGNLLFLIIL